MVFRYGLDMSETSLNAKCGIEGFSIGTLEQNLRLKTLGYLFFIPAIFYIRCLAAPWPTFGYYRGNSLIHPVLKSAFRLLGFCPKVTARG